MLNWMKRRCAESLPALLIVTVVAGAGLPLTAALTGCETGPLARRPAVAPAQPPEPTELQHQVLADARTLLDAGEYERALASFREILAENPTITTAYIGIGDVHLARREYDKAEPAFARAVRLEPRNFDAQFGHGIALQMLDRLVEAVRAYQRALTIEPDHPRANLNLATTYLQMDEPGSARIFAEKAVEVDPLNGPARANLGAIYEKLERNEDAINQYLTAIELMDDATPLMLNLINVLSRERRYQEMVNTAEHLAMLEPSAPVYERLGWGYFRLHRYDDSIEAYRRATEIDPRHWPAWSGVGVNALNSWLLSDGDNQDAFREARSAFRRSLQVNPDQPRLLTLMSNYGL